MRPRWEGADDAQLAGHLHYSARVNKLKPLAALDIDPRAIAGEKLLSAGMARQHWTWDTVPDDWAPYWQYGALDPVLTAHLLAKFMPEIRSQFGASYDLELAYAHACAMAAAGMTVPISTRMAGSGPGPPSLSWLRDHWGITAAGSRVGHALERARCSCAGPTGLRR